MTLWWVRLHRADRQSTWLEQSRLSRSIIAYTFVCCAERSVKTGLLIRIWKIFSMLPPRTNKSPWSLSLSSLSIPRPALEPQGRNQHRENLRPLPHCIRSSFGPPPTTPPSEDTSAKCRREPERGGTRWTGVSPSSATETATKAPASGRKHPSHHERSRVTRYYRPHHRWRTTIPMPIAARRGREGVAEA